MRILTSLALIAVVLSLPWTALAAPFFQASIDIKSLALTPADLPRGFEALADRTLSEERPDGVAVYDVTYGRERTPENLAAGPFEVRSGVARTAQVDDARAQLGSTKDAFLAEGWTETPVPGLGDESIGLTQTTDGEGGRLALYSYLFRKNNLILMIGVRGRPEVTKMDNAVALAIAVSGRVDKALGGGAPAPATGAPPASSGGSSAPRSGTGERVRVVNVDGGSANVRSDPSTSADVVGEVAEGTVLDVVGPNRDGDGRSWRNVRVNPTQTGWIAATLVETVSQPSPAGPPPPGPSPAPSPAAGAAPTSAGPTPTSSDTPPADSGEPPSDAPPPADSPPPAATDLPPVPPPPAPSPAANSAGTSPAGNSASGTTAHATGNGLTVDVMVRDAQLSSGKQNVKVKVTRDGGPVSDAYVDVTAQLDPKRYHAMRADRTSVDGYTEVEWDMEGPPGNYQVIVKVRTSETGPETTATAGFRWK